MARRSVRNVRRAAPKFKWCGARDEHTVQAGSNLVLADFVPLCNSLSDSEAQGDVVIERIIIDLMVRRLLDTAVDQLGFIVQVQEDSPVTAAPSAIINPVDATNPEFTFGNRDILLFGQLSMPPNISVGNAAGVQVSNGGINHRFEFRARRRLHRLNDAVNLWLATDGVVDGVFKVMVLSRILLRYSS